MTWRFNGEEKSQEIGEDNSDGITLEDSSTALTIYNPNAIPGTGLTNVNTGPACA